MLLKRILFVFVLFIANNLFAQQNIDKCLTNVIRSEKIKDNPSLITEYQRIEIFTKNWISENENILKKTNLVVQIPVVVHVVWREDVENISNEQIQSQIDVLNQDYRKLNSNFSNTPSAFLSVAADVEMEFRLAIQDPDGNSTSGITRTQTSVDDIAAGSDYYKTINGGIDPWDQNSYLNIWICDVGEDGLLGFATIPSDNDPGDGVVIPNHYFGTTGTAANSAPNNLGRTATHEIGHYFNLEHIWGTEESGCTDDDYVDDTPKQDWDSQGCNTFPFFDDCTTSGNGIMFMNYMDYSDDECMTMFTNGQKLRMLAALNGPRNGLLISKGLDPITSVERKNIEKNVIGFYPNPAKNILNISSKNGGKYSIKIYNILGEVMTKKVSRVLHHQIDISKFKSGIYFVEAELTV